MGRMTLITTGERRRRWSDEDRARLSWMRSKLSSKTSSALLADWPAEKQREARDSGSLPEASEVANLVMFMLTRPRGMTIRDVAMLPTNFDL